MPLSLNVNSDNNTANNGRRFNLNANNEPSNVAPMVLIYIQVQSNNMKTYTKLYEELCSYDNLKLAWKKARKRKTLKSYIIEFESDLENNLNKLKYELETFTYAPAPLRTFIVHDPKTRKISASHFRDRVVHHALCNIIGPILERNFIYDSFANQKGKGVNLAIKRLEYFIRKIYRTKAQNSLREGQLLLNKSKTGGFAIKTDIRHYFDSVDYEILLRIIKKKIKDTNVIWLIKLILKNHKTKINGKGMPLGNLTSQFFANVYLNELDQFVKHKLKARHYIRYVDDFILLNKDERVLRRWKEEIDLFIRNNLKIELHPDKTKIILINKGITMLGFRVFLYHKFLKKSNAKRIWKRIDFFKKDFIEGKLNEVQIKDSISGWIVYAKFANTYYLRKKVYLNTKRIFLDHFFFVTNSPNVASSLLP